MDPPDRARIPRFYAHSIAERLALLCQRGIISAAEATGLAAGDYVLAPAAADRMVENVVGVFGLPLGLALNFLVDGRAYVVPMAVEEASIIAALSGAAKRVAAGGGFVTEAEPPLLIGQVQVVDVAHPAHAQAALLQRRAEVVGLANSLHPRMVARGGGCRDIEVRLLPAPPSAEAGADMLVVHLLVDTCEAMGANLVNTMCEGVAALIEQISGGRAFLRILSNLTDRALVRARCRVPVDALAGRGFAGAAVRDGIVLANDFALADPYRAATHNKGIMNGIDAVALATGNDWRALAAAAHAYAGRGPGYTALTRWRVGDDGALEGELVVPLKVGTVGGNLRANPAVGLAQRILAVRSARELAAVLACVGLGQNLAALRALVTHGIQAGHMALHARSVAMSTGAPPAMLDALVEALVASGEVKLWRAQELLADLQRAAMNTATGTVAGASGGSSGRGIGRSGDTARSGDTVRSDDTGRSGDTVRGTGAGSSSREPALWAPAGHGKVVLLGEHAVVYGTHALAAPLSLSVRARVEATDADGVQLLIPPWGVTTTVQVDARAHAGAGQGLLHASLALLLHRLEIAPTRLRIVIEPGLPRAAGLGGSAALAVAVVRALGQHFALGLDDAAVNALAFACESLAHGDASGVDNTVATYGQALLFRGGQAPLRRPLQLPAPVELVIGLSGVESLTARMVAQVRRAHARSPALYERIFAEIDALTLAACAALEQGDLPALGELMNVNHGLLNALQVSTWQLEELVGIARAHGALGAKLTGGGGGGGIVALCPGRAPAVAAAIEAAGYRALTARVG